MQFPITRCQLNAAVEVYGFADQDARRIVAALEAAGRISLTGSMLEVHNPTDPDAACLAGICREARGGSAGSVGHYKIREYLGEMLARASSHGTSRRV